MERRLRRRHLLQAGAVAGASALLVGQRAVDARTSGERVTASGAGVNLKLMPDEAGNPTVPLREPFAFDAHYAQCVVEDNSARFAMDTFGMGRVVIEPHRFFMAMYAEQIALSGVRHEADGALTATLEGRLSCATYAGTASVEVGSREAAEHARFRIEATDGGFGPEAPPDRFAFTVFFDPAEAPVNHAIFGPEATFTGELVAGKITIGPPALEEVTEATPAAATPAPEATAAG
jgi:hypothetical protein